MPVLVKLTPLLFSILSLVVAIRLNNQSLKLIYAHQISTFFETCKWYYNESVNNYLSLPVLRTGRYVFEQYEKRVLEQYGPLFLVKIIARVIYK